jgi:hypothetical protein
MQYKTLVWRAVLGLLLSVPVAVGCSRYVNPDITDPREARTRLAADKALCQSLANENVPPTYGLERYSPDPTIEGQADQYVANVLEGDANTDVFSRCMRDRGWRFTN